MTEADKAPSVGELINQFIFDHWGRVGLVALALLGAAFFVWSQWNSIRTWPGVAWLVARLGRKALPKADPRRFSVAVLHLAGDDAEQSHKQLIVRLLQDFEGLQVIPVDRTIAIAAGATEEQARQGHAAARRHLDRTGASLAIWGRVLTHGGQTRPDLFLTAAAGQDGRPRQYPLETSAEFRLPAVFWEDLAQVLQVVIATQDEKFRAEQGRYVADRLQPFIARVERLLAATPQQRGWKADDIAATQVTLADALLTLGEQSGQNAPLEKAVAAYRQALEEWTRDRVPLQWASTQNNLGVALLRLGERESETARLKEAVEAYGEALKERTRDRVPLDWASTQNNLGGALLRLGERESGTAGLEQAVEAFRQALKERTRDRVPLQWASTQNNLGGALLRLGERESGTAGLEQAVEAYGEALKEWTRDRVPLDWAMTQNNLGLALWLLAERTGDRARLAAARAATAAAFEVFRQAGHEHERAGFEERLRAIDAQLAATAPG